MTLSLTQKSQLEKHLDSKKSLRFCFVCEADNKWSFNELVLSLAIYVLIILSFKAIMATADLIRARE